MSQYTIEEWEEPGLGHIEIAYDPDPEVANPRGDSNVGVMVCAHSRYTLGDEQVDTPEFTIPCPTCSGDGGGTAMICPGCSGRGELSQSPEDYFRKTRGARVVLPLWLYDHSGLAISCGERRGSFADRWDSGQVGYIFDTPQGVAECLGEATDEQIQKALEGEVETYNMYLGGQVYEYVVTALNGEEDSCGGFLGDLDSVKTEAVAALRYLAPGPTTPPRTVEPAGID